MIIRTPRLVRVRPLAARPKRSREDDDRVSAQEHADGAVAGNDRIIAVLDALITRPIGDGWGVRELADAVAASRSTVNRILQGLAERGLARVDANATYSVGPRLRVLAKVLHDRHPLLHGALPLIEELSQTADATVMLAVHGPRPGAAFIALLRQQPGPVRYHLEPGMELPLHAGAAGRAILSEVGVDVLQPPLARYSEDTVIDTARLADDLRVTREAGYAISVGQHIPLAAGVAAPLRFGPDLVAAVSATRLRHSTTDADLERLGPMVRKAADAIEDAAHPRVGSERPARPSGGDGTALGRVQRLLEILVAEPSGAPTGTELARRLGANEATAARLRATALASGLAVPTAGRRMAAGPLLLRWAARIGPAWDIADLAGDALQALARASGETVGLAVFDPGTATATLAAEAGGTRPVEYSLGVGSPIPLYAGAAGKAILAHCPAETVQNQPLQPLTPRSPTTMEQLRRDLRRIRDTGWARAEGERIPDAFGLAVPFFADGAVAGSLTFTIPRFHVDEVDVPSLTTMLSETARELTALLSL
ncbi:DNA-binding IclR family transcriptional regulator [Geodermatophilus bullaregiensis]|uniref:IclR family transcriptional regulator n=1 Tax=Geodermatophilus bullaregiensis TaxID=1564160 RepID=UPI00195E824E|nr:IclR family transcriptional regulator C-terminal domain-containing protein [Geodermatophilus bullaregiensis]MBM7804478.1 DNA-binding IclR family transcriptional regulator [Geodermatophilus bullaregiensis]